MPTTTLPANWITGNSYGAGNQNSVETVVNTHTSKLAAVPVQPACRVATTGSETFTITSGSVTQINGTTIDGVSVAVNDYVLVKDAPASSGTGSLLSSQPGNGIYQVTGNTTNISLSRAAQMSSTADAATPAGMVAVVEAGTVAGSTQWVVSSPNSAAAFTYGTTAMQWKSLITAAGAMLMPVRLATTGAETYTITSGSVTQINGTTIDGVSPSIGDRFMIATAPAASGAGTLYALTTQPGNGIYTVTGNTTNLTVARSTDMSGSVMPSGLSVFVTAGTVYGATAWSVNTPNNPVTAFTWATTSLGWKQLGNRFVAPRVGTTTSTATPSIDCGLYDLYTITALATAITGVTVTSTPVEGQKLMVRIKDNGYAQAITWGSSFVASGASALLTTTIVSKTHLCSFMYDAVAAKWVAIATDFNGY